jgi:hypothetical protein
MDMTGKRRGEGQIGLIIGLIVLFVVGYAAFKVVPIHISGNAVFDIMNEQANFGGMKPLDKIRWEITRKAEEENVPLAPTDLKVYHKGAMIVIEAKWTQTIDVLGYKYVYNFDRRVEKPVF